LLNSSFILRLKDFPFESGDRDNDGRWTNQSNGSCLEQVYVTTNWHTGACGVGLCVVAANRCDGVSRIGNDVSVFLVLAL
jgi:hypothetical protein